MAERAFNEIMKLIYASSTRSNLVGRLRSKLNLKFVLDNLEEVEKNLKKRNALICDVGCQTGYIGAYLGLKGYSTIGLDINCPSWQKQVWKSFRSRFECSFLLADGRHLPFRKGAFDAIVAYATIEHIPNKTHVLEEVHRILSTNGIFFIFGLPRRKSYSEKLARSFGLWHHDFLSDEIEIRNMLERQGFEVWELRRAGLLPISLELWNIAYLWLIFYHLERLLIRTPLNIASHSLTIIVHKKFVKRNCRDELTR